MNEEYIDNVKHLIEQKDADTVKGLLIDLHPADIAELCNDLNPEEAKFIYRLLDNEIAADVLVEMDEDARKELLEMLPSETIAKRFVDYMDTDDAVDLMRELDEDKHAFVDEETIGKLFFPVPLSSKTCAFAEIRLQQNKPSNKILFFIF